MLVRVEKLPRITNVPVGALTDLHLIVRINKKESGLTFIFF